MKQQEAFNRVVAVHSNAVDRLISRHLFAGYPNARKPLAVSKEKIAENRHRRVKRAWRGRPPPKWLRLQLSAPKEFAPQKTRGQ